MAVNTRSRRLSEDNHACFESLTRDAELLLSQPPSGENPTPPKGEKKKRTHILRPFAHRQLGPFRYYTASSLIVRNYLCSHHFCLEHSRRVLSPHRSIIPIRIKLEQINGARNGRLAVILKTQ